MSTNPITIRVGGIFGVDGLAASNTVGRYVRLEQSIAGSGSSNERSISLGLGRTITLAVLENIGADTTAADVQAKLDVINAGGGCLYSVLADDVALVLTDKQGDRLTEDGLTDDEAKARYARYEARFLVTPKDTSASPYFAQTFMWGSARASEDLRAKVAQPSGALTQAKAKVEVN